MTGGRWGQPRGTGWGRIVRSVLADESACALCGSEREPTVDHIVPISRGGTDARANLRRLCGPCHRTKTAHEGNAAKRPRKRPPERHPGAV